MNKFLKKIAPYIAAGLTLFSTLNYAQSKVPINMRLVEKGTNTGIVKGEKILVYTPKGTDTLTTQDNGYIQGLVTDVKEDNTATTTQKTVWIKPNDTVQNTEDVLSATIYNILGQKETDVTNDVKAGNKLHLNLATAIHFLYIVEKDDHYAIKLFINGNQYEGGSQHKKNITINNPNKLYKTLETTVIDSIRSIESDKIVGEKILTNYTTNQNPINIGNIEVTVKMLREITAYGVDADSGKTAQPLIDADVWVGTRDLSKAKYYGKTGTNGKITLRTPKNGQDTLFIQANGYHQRNKLINNNGTNITEYAITDKIDIDFFNYVYLGNNEQYKLRNPDDKWNHTLPFYLVNPVNETHKQYAIDAVEQGIQRFTGGKYTGIITTDSTKAYGKIRWKMGSGNGAITLYHNSNDWSKIDSVDIEIVPITDPTFNPYAKDAINKEINNSLYDQIDILTSNVPQSWKVSKQYQGNDQVFQSDTPQWDVDNGVVAGKLPQGYIINVIHQPRPQ